MKNGIITLAVILLASIQLSAQEQKVITTAFGVSGVCGMCEDRIEKAMDVKGVKAADYDLDTRQLTVTYATKHITEKELHELLNAVGHDTESSEASDKEYDSVHACCKYREHGDH